MMEQERANLIFVCGALRSGTSLLHLMLDHHPDLANPGEFDFLFDKLTESGEYPDVGTYLDWLSTHRIFLSKSLEVTGKASSYQRLMSDFISQLQAQNHVLALNIHRRFHLVPSVFPQARYIHLIRDPRDVARSSIGMGWAGNVFYGVDHWLKSEMSWQKLRQALSPERFIEIRFEQLIEQPRETLQQLCSFLGVPYHEQMLGYAEGSTYEKPDVTLINQWQSKLSPLQIRLVESKSAKLMNKLGYQLSGYPALKPHLWLRLRLWLHNKSYKLWFSIKRYGFWLTFKHRLAGWLGLSNFHKATLLEKNEIDKRYIK